MAETDKTLKDGPSEVNGRSYDRKGCMMRRVRFFAATLVAIAALLPLRARADTPVTIGVVPVLPSASVFVALDKGYFRDAGFDVKIVTVDSANELVPFLASGRMQVVEGGIAVGYFNAVAQGQPITLALNANSTPLYANLMVRPDLKDKIRKVTDLKGRKIAIVNLASIQTYIVAKVLDSAGMSVKDIDLVAIPFPQMGAAFANNAIDAALPVPPFVDAFAAKGLAVRWLDPDTVVRPTPFDAVAYMVNTDWASQHRPAADRLFLALARAGRDYCQAYHHGPNRAAVIETLVKHKVMADRALLERMPWQSRDPDGRVNVAGLLDVQNWFLKLGLIHTKMPADRLIDTHYAEDAAKALGPFHVINTNSTLAGCR